MKNHSSVISERDTVQFTLHCPEARPDAARLQTDHEGYLYVRSEYRLVKVEVDDITYIEGLSDYVKIHLKSTPHPLLTLMTMKRILEELPETQFARIHRSYIVAIDQVKSIQNKKAEMPDGTALPISNSYQEFVGRWGRR